MKNIGVRTERGFIHRESDPDDKRVSLILFTEQGWQFLQDAYLVKQGIEAKYAAILGNDGLTRLRSSLERLLGGWHLSICF